MFEQAATKRNRFVHRIREALTVPKQELAHNLKSSNEAQKSPTYSDYGVDWSEKQKCMKTLTPDARQPWTDSRDCYSEYLLIHFDYLFIG